VQHVDAGGAVVSARIVDNWHAQAVRCGQGHGLHHLENDVGGSDQIDVVAAELLQPQHESGQRACVQRLAIAAVRNVGILAEHAVQVAMGEEDGAAAGETRDGTLFAEMGGRAGHDGVPAGAAPPTCIGQPIDTAGMGTEITRPGAAAERRQQGGEPSGSQGVEIDGPRCTVHRQTSHGNQAVVFETIARPV